MPLRQRDRLLPASNLGPHTRDFVGEPTNIAASPYRGVNSPNMIFAIDYT